MIIFGFAARAALAQNTPVVIPPAPPIVATPIAPPAALTPPAAAPPPGLVPSSLPPDDTNAAPDGTGAPAAGDAGVPPDSNNGVPADSDTGLAAPPPDDGAIAPAAGGATSPPPPADSWLPGTTAELRVLNQVDGSVSQVQIPVGGQSQVGDMQVSVQSCLRRPPDQVPDAAVFLSAVPAPPAGDDGADADTSPDAAAPADATAPADAAAPADGAPADQSTGDQPDLPAGYRGWLLRSAPGAAMAGDASESLSLIDCL